MNNKSKKQNVKSEINLNPKVSFSSTMIAQFLETQHLNQEEEEEEINTREVN